MTILGHNRPPVGRSKFCGNFGPVLVLAVGWSGPISPARRGPLRAGNVHSETKWDPKDGCLGSKTHRRDTKPQRGVSRFFEILVLLAVARCFLLLLVGGLLDAQAHPIALIIG